MAQKVGGKPPVEESVKKFELAGKEIYPRLSQCSPNELARLSNLLERLRAEVSAQSAIAFAMDVSP